MHPFAEFVKKFLFMPVLPYICFIVCVHRSFHSWQVFLILFKPIGTIVHYSVYVLNRYRGSIDILDSLPYTNKLMSQTSFHGDCQNIVSVS